MNETIAARSTVGSRESARPRRSFLRRHPEIWVALVLWLASNAFVAMFSTLAAWETGVKYAGISDFCKWDCGWYGTVVTFGYDKAPHSTPDGTANWPFHPLFPISVYPLHKWLHIPLTTALVLASKIGFLFAIYTFLLLLSDQLKTTSDYVKAGSLVAFNPYLIYAHAGYAEPLYFGLAALAFYLVEQRRWIASGLAGAFLSAARLIGFLFFMSYAIVWVRKLGGWSSWRKSSLGQILGFLLCPLGTALFMLYMYHINGDAFTQAHISIAWGKPVGNPFGVLWSSLTASGWPFVWGATALAGFIASAWLIRLRKPEFAAYLAISIIIPLSANAQAMPRYVWWQPPFLYAIYFAIRRYPVLWTVYMAVTGGVAAFFVTQWLAVKGFLV